MFNYPYVFTLVFESGRVLRSRYTFVRPSGNVVYFVWLGRMDVFTLYAYKFVLLWL